MIKLLIGGDICPTENNIELFKEGNSKVLFNDLLENFEKSDFVIANLEFPIIEKKTPIAKSGAVFGAQIDVLNGLKNAGINFLNLSNNHILDHGEIGLKSTLSALKKFNFEFSGAGENLKEASTVFTKTIDNITISIISYCEHEFSTASNNNAGANPLDLIDFINKINLLKETSDFILLLYHGGKENYNLPTPNQMKLCRFFIEQGVDMVSCQHSHTAGLIENYNNGVIFYGQGNFVFDPFPLKKKWLYEGLLVDLKIFGKGKFEYEIIPYIHKSLIDGSVGIRKMNSDESMVFIENLDKLNSNFKLNPNLVIESWEQLSKKLENTYMSVLNGNGKLIRKLNEKTSFLNSIYKGSKRLTLKNIISCETHREILETILKK
jgi:poly-gamma-glutamate synthesis protein (capsule biosynthesis protein)